MKWLKLVGIYIAMLFASFLVGFVITWSLILVMDFFGPLGGLVSYLIFIAIVAATIHWSFSDEPNDEG